MCTKSFPGKGMEFIRSKGPHFKKLIQYLLFLVTRNLPASFPVTIFCHKHGMPIPQTHQLTFSGPLGPSRTWIWSHSPPERVPDLLLLCSWLHFSFPSSKNMQTDLRSGFAHEDSSQKEYPLLLVLPIQNGQTFLLNFLLLVEYLLVSFDVCYSFIFSWALVRFSKKYLGQCFQKW